MHAYIYARRRRNRKDRRLAIELRRKLRKNPKVQKSKRCEIAKSNNRIIQKSKSTNMQKIWNIKKIYAALRIICQHTTESNLVQTSKGTSTNVKPRITYIADFPALWRDVDIIYFSSFLHNEFNKYKIRFKNNNNYFLASQIPRIFSLYFTSFGYLNFWIFE